MTNPTSNYSWQMPTSTDLVTDLPADFEVFGQAVDTQMKTNADAATQKATLTTKGDIYAATGTSTPARLAVGTNDQVLTADSSTATGLKWATAGGGDTTWTLVNTGGTTLTGAATITISGITKDKIFIYTDAAYCLSGSVMTMRFNSDSSSKYGYAGPSIRQTATYVGSGFGSTVQSVFVAVNGDTSSILGYMSGSNSASLGGYVQVIGAKSTGTKTYTTAFGTNNASSGSNGYSTTTGGLYTGSSAITSVSFINSAGNFNGGTIYVYEG